jgi:hypothetical protein
VRLLQIGMRYMGVRVRAIEIRGFLCGVFYPGLLLAK